MAENPTQTPQAEAARAEMGELMKTDDWKRGLPSAHAKADAIYQRHFPEAHGKTVTIDGDGIRLEGDSGDPFADLKVLWGQEYEVKRGLAIQVSRELFAGKEQALMRLGDLMGIPEVIDLLPRASHDSQLRSALQLVIDHLNR